MTFRKKRRMPPHFTNPLPTQHHKFNSFNSPHNHYYNQFQTTLHRILMSTLCMCTLCCALFQSKKQREARLAAEQAALEADRLSKLVVVFGVEFEKTGFYVAVTTSIVLIVAVCFELSRSRSRRKEEGGKNEEGRETGRGAKGASPVKVADKKLISSQGVMTKQKPAMLDVVVVGCGLPKQGIGWFHIMQFLQMSSVNVRAVVEPYYMDEKRCPDPPSSFIDLIATLREMGIKCVYHVSQLKTLPQPTLCVIAGKTRENPKLFRECIGMGATHIYLEIPGAPSVGHLREMKSLADTRGVEVYMGYQKLTAAYIEKAVALSRSIPNTHAFFCHNESYLKNELPRVFDRYSDGLLRSLASQELAVLVTQYGVVASVIDKFKVNTNRLFSEKKTIYNKTNGSQLVDLSRVAFKITTKKGLNVSVMADRSGGLVSFAVVKNAEGKEIQRYESPGEDVIPTLQRQIREDKEMVRQYIVQNDEFLELKERVVESILYGRSPKNVASIKDGINVMVLADYCQAEIDDVLKCQSE